ncbi:hypothetical protein CRG98_003683 [Punica granatum]|uniref:Uncharacterized protein n=1 Tax=Punica granatum TaxID=22663 RepID=A0A2I0L5E4_PUNGR|nr:hypothetical protein CRG98_003683 [Punica granatum]
MASTCINNIGMSPDNFPAPSYPTYDWLSQTRLSFTPNDDYSMSSTTAFQRQPPSPPQQQARDTSLRIRIQSRPAGTSSSASKIRGSNASSSSDSSLNMPLLKDLDSDFVMIYPHLSLSSSPFGSQEHEEVF